jgi:hypothetical protein
LVVPFSALVGTGVARGRHETSCPVWSWLSSPATEDTFDLLEGAVPVVIAMIDVPSRRIINAVRVRGFNFVYAVPSS